MQKKFFKIGAKIIVLDGFRPLNHLFRGGLRTQAPDTFRLNPPSQLIIGYHWLAFLNQVHKNL